MKIYLTFDVEEWTIPEDYKVRSRFNNNTKFSREGCKNLLDLLDKHNIKSTFFITGYFAEREKNIVKEISKKGHEIASHGYKHKYLDKSDSKKIKDEIMKSQKILSKLSKDKIIGFRAPNLSINKDIIDILFETDFKYDSSIHPAIVPGYYHNLNLPLNPYKDKILELPLSVIPLIRFPISWLWMRNLGNWITNIGINMNLKNRDVILYFHAWEFTPIPKIKGVPFYIARNTGIFLKVLERLITNYPNQQFGKLEDFNYENSANQNTFSSRR